MAGCVYCNQAYKGFEPIVKCKVLECQKWSHKECALLNYNINLSSWACSQHKRGSQAEFTLQDLFEDSNPKDPVTNSTPLFVFGNPLLTSSRTKNQTNNKRTRHKSVTNNVRQKTNLVDNSNEKNDKKICSTCKLEIEGNFAVCKTCNNPRHAHCMTRDEEGTVDSINKTFVCNNCIKLIIEMRNNPNNVTNNNINNITNKNHSKPENIQHQFPPRNNTKPKNPTNKLDSALYSHYRTPPIYNVESSDDESDDEERFRTFHMAPPRFGNRRSNNNNNYANHGNHTYNVPNNTNINADNFFFKLQLEKLPEVIDSDMSWNVFYTTYTETKHYFTASENVRRIQKAIKDENVKRIGGKGLFNMLTYDRCIEEVNKRLRHNLSFLSSEARNIENFSRIKNENKSKLVEFIDKLRNFSTISEAYQDLSYMNSRRFLANICDILPYNLRNKWEEKQARLENANIAPSLKHMVRILDKELPRIEASIRNDKLRSHEKDYDKKIGKHQDKNSRSYSTNFSKSSSSMISVGKYESHNDTYKCWFHKSNDHLSTKCKALWEMNGKDVANLARKNHICTFCGQERHNPCPNSSKIKCFTPGCDFPHHALFCYKRLSNKSKDPDNKTKDDHKNKSKAKISSSNSNKSQKSKDEFQEIDSSEESLFNKLKNHNYYTNLPPDLQTYIKNFQSKQSTHKVDTFEKIEIRSNSTATDDNILAVLVIKLENQARYAFLLDSGSSISLIEEDVANELNLKGPWLPLKLVWSGNKTRYDNASRVVKATASNIAYKKEDKHIYFRTVRNLNVCPQKFVAKDIYHEHPKFRSLRLFDHCIISGIIGVDNIFAFEQLQCIKSISQEKYEFYGIHSPLGDYIHGTNMPMSRIYKELNENKRQNVDRFMHSHRTMFQREHEKLNDMERETMGLNYDMPRENDRIPYEEKYVLDLLNKNVKKDFKDNHYVAPLLWKEDFNSLPTLESFKLSYVRYLIMEKQSIALGRFEECVDQIKNLIDNNYATEMSYDEYSKFHPKAYYNPVFFIHPKGKRTRLIWDLAAKIKEKSLNDYLMAGPNLYNNLVEMLFKMREHDILFKSDIKEMFHQIKVNEDDTNALRFLFRFHPNDKIRIFKLNVLPFGASCSPVISQFVKDKVASDHKDENPIACQLIQKSCYVDDIITSVKDKENAVNLVVDIKRILHDGGFKLLKINSNKTEVLDEIKKKLTDKEMSDENVISQLTKEKILGYDLDFVTDNMSIASCLPKIPFEILDCSKRPTKKQVLQILMTIFDPIGFIQFFTAKLKLVYHRMCKSLMSWDDKIDDKDYILWKKCMNWIKSIDSIKIPRLYCFKNHEVLKIQCWAFGDASAEIMCGTVYARFLNENSEQINVSLIYAKTFVVPYKQKRTIPELELSVALKISKMAETVKNYHSLKFDQYFFITDNQAVKSWIVNGVKKPSIYVKNRIDKINNLTDKNNWFWISTDLMPADYGTKESTMPSMKYHNDWFVPKLFCLPERDWTFMKSNRINIHDGHEIDENLFDPKNFSNLSHLISSGQLALKWLNKVQLKNLEDKILTFENKLQKDSHNRELKNDLKELKAKLNEKLNEASNESSHYVKIESMAIKNAQYDMYEKEIDLIKADKVLPHSSSIYKLSPFLDANGILRATSRLSYNENNLKIFGYDRIYPIILPKNHNLTKLIIMKYHENNHHMMTNTVIVNLLKKYFIPHIKWTVTSIIRQNCYVCRRSNCKPDNPMMSDLPSHRLAFCVKPFTYCIADLAGPIIVHNYRGRDTKRYIFLYSCLTTRAVHLELIEDLTSESTLLALQNTMNIRGAPKCITTDNGSNFIGADNIIQKAHTEWNKKLLKKGLIIEPIEWKFAPAKAPHMQGSIERIVGLVKTAISKMTATINKNHVRYNDFQLKAILYEIVGLLNNRPISMLPMTKLNGEFLTPNHFLIGRQNIQSVPICENVKETDIREHWEDIKLLTSILWKHWLSAYIPTIMMREK